MQIFFAKSFKKDYRRLQSGIREQCNTRLHLFEREPHHTLLNNHVLHNPYAGCRSINITGDYRAIFYNEDMDTVRFIAVGTHHELFGT